VASASKTNGAVEDAGLALDVSTSAEQEIVNNGGSMHSGNRIATSTSSVSATSDDLKTKHDSYSWYSVELTNRSIVDEHKRDEIRKHLIWLATQLDDDSLDHQLITLKYDMMSCSDPMLAADVQTRAAAIDAKVSIRDENA
jgi:hypothetical protein